LAGVSDQLKIENGPPTKKSANPDIFLARSCMRRFAPGRSLVSTASRQ
jgi:hypothetical protein